MSESVQKKLLKVRAPRVKITYDLETDGASIAKELPVVLGIIGDYSGMRDSSKEFVNYKDRKFVFLSSDSFDETLKSMKPRILVSIPVYKENNNNSTDTANEENQEHKTIELNFECFEDFQPLNIVKKVEFLNKFYEEKRVLSELRTKGEINELVMLFLNKMIIDNGFRNNIKTQTTSEDMGEELKNLFEMTHSITDEQKSYIKQLLSSFIISLEAFLTYSSPASAVPTVDTSNNNSTAITVAGTSTTTDLKSYIEFYNVYVIKLNDYLSYYLNNILHDKNFQKLEGSWKGLAYILSNSVITDNMRIRVLNASSDELYTDLTKSMEFDQSSLFKKVYEAEYGTFGGSPYTTMMLDYAVGKNSRDFTIVKKISEVMAASHCPLFAGVDPSLFSLKSFANMNEPYSISKIFDGVDLVEYRGFRETEDAKYLSLILPRVLSRTPYNTNIVPIEGLSFVESIDVDNENDFTWMNAAYIYVTQVLTSYGLYGWFGSISGVENGGRIDNLPLYIYQDTNGESVGKCPTEVAITDRREKELSDLGFITLCNAKNENYGVFFGCNNTYKPPLFTKDTANANCDLTTRAPFILNTSRFAHYLKCMMRDKVGSFVNKDNVKGFLCEWLSRYTLLDDNASGSLKVQYPLREFSVKVDDLIGKPGQYKAVILFRPHDQFQAIELSLRLVAQMPK